MRFDGVTLGKVWPFLIGKILLKIMKKSGNILNVHSRV